MVWKTGEILRNGELLSLITRIQRLFHAFTQQEKNLHVLILSIRESGFQKFCRIYTIGHYNRPVNANPVNNGVGDDVSLDSGVGGEFQPNSRTIPDKTNVITEHQAIENCAQMETEHSSLCIRGFLLHHRRFGKQSIFCRPIWLNFPA